jgi:2'-5' RNA ligase
MPSEPNWQLGQIPTGQRPDIHALVAYVPNPLGRFLDDLRLELAPDCDPHAHISVLPPRPAAADWPEISAHTNAVISRFSSFDVELLDVEIFPVTGVIYIALGSGSAEFRALHDALASGPLAFPEPFVFQPHLTLAQEIPAGRATLIEELARRRWAEYRGPRCFRADRAVFVQNTADSRWRDLAEFPFGPVALR